MDDVFHSYRYLIIDDFDQMRLSFKSMLAGVGARDILTQGSGEAAIKSLANDKFDVVICDYNLGEGKDGQQLLEEARHLGYLGHACTFFMVTAESNMPMVLGALEHQPDEYMVKPINREVLLHRLASALKRKGRLTEIDEALSQGDKSRAIELCIEQQGSDLKQSLYLAKLQGELCIELGRCDEAQAVYEALMRIRNFPWAHFGLGKIAFLRGDVTQARQTFETLIKQNRHYLEAYDWLVKVLEQDGKSEDVQSLLMQATKLSPKSVQRQRELARIALQNGDVSVAERAYQAAVRWGRNSCFASAEEYRQLAALYRDSGQTSKMLRLLTDGRQRFTHQPGDKLQVLCSQALFKQQLDQRNDIDVYLQEVERILENHKHELLEGHLLTTACECYQLSRAEMAESIMRIVLSNHHDEAEWIERVRQLMSEHGRHAQADQLIRSVKCELDEVHRRCNELLNNGGTEKAFKLLNDTIDLYPGNRTLVLLSVSAMIDYMRRHGVDQGYHFRCRHALAHLLDRNRQDAEADHYMGQLTQLPG
jgi:DNA-binding NarL/FixJ family response regulator/DNA-binding SARP family transcriptional activator